MAHLNLWDVFVVLIAVAGPPKVILSFARLAEGREARELRRLALRTAAAATVCGVVVAMTAEPLLHLFHIGDADVMIAGGGIFFVYALRLVLDGHADAPAGAPDEGFMALLLPYVASPLAMTSVIVLAVTRNGWWWPALVALAYLAVVAANLVTMLALTYVLHWVPRTWIEVGGRLLGLLLAAVGVDLAIVGLQAMGIIARSGHP
ncbi:hypothetical protein NE236_02785 [Actinoallomurus purpureus]|uniref:MarC family protein n=1 Tax=Actinoallomurus purpureus TaxID=478114 RepID=UPI002093431B|nr:MarC family protein [Actinoallomurus purpureus]MCO6003895.1 hypothetical protein [Actinoallomurus purpureus]